MLIELVKRERAERRAFIDGYCQAMKEIMGVIAQRKCEDECLIAAIVVRIDECKQSLTAIESEEGSEGHTVKEGHKEEGDHDYDDE